MKKIHDTTLQIRMSKSMKMRIKAIVGNRESPFRSESAFVRSALSQAIRDNSEYIDKEVMNGFPPIVVDHKDISRRISYKEIIGLFQEEKRAMHPREITELLDPGRKHSINESLNYLERKGILKCVGYRKAQIKSRRKESGNEYYSTQTVKMYALAGNGKDEEYVGFKEDNIVFLTQYEMKMYKYIKGNEGVSPGGIMASGEFRTGKKVMDTVKKFIELDLMFNIKGCLIMNMETDVVVRKKNYHSRVEKERKT